MWFVLLFKSSESDDQHEIRGRFDENITYDEVSFVVSPD